MKKPLNHTTTNIAIVAIITFSALPLAAGEKHIPIWPNGVPNSQGDETHDKPELIHYPADSKTANGASVIICPGGGYSVLAIDHEGAQVARWLNSFGVSAFVLKYRLTKHGYTPKDAFMDGQRAIRFLRHNAKEMKIDPDRIGVLGFSAGGNLAATLSLNHDKGNPVAEHAINNHSSRPNFSILIYAAYVADAKRKDLVKLQEPDGNTPPAFIAVTGEDRFHTSSLALAQKYRQAKVDTELHMFGGWGPHGLGLAAAEPGFGQWPALTKTWIRKQGLLTTAPKANVKGQITIDGKPLHRGWIKFTPKGDNNKPIVADYITHRDDGKFELTGNRAICQGEYTVSIWELATEFLDDPSIPDANSFFTDGSVTVEVVDVENGFDFQLERK